MHIDHRGRLLQRLALLARLLLAVRLLAARIPGRPGSTTADKAAEARKPNRATDWNYPSRTYATDRDGSAQAYAAGLPASGVNTASDPALKTSNAESRAIPASLTSPSDNHPRDSCVRGDGIRTLVTLFEY